MRLERLVAQIRKEVLSVLRDPRTRIVLIGPPLVQLFVFAFAATLEVENVSLAVLDRDDGRWSHELIERVRATRMGGDVLVVDSRETLSEIVDARRALAAMTFQPDFSRRIGAGREASVDCER